MRAADTVEMPAMVRDDAKLLEQILQIAEALDAAARFLDGASESPRLDAEVLLSRALDVDRSYLFAHPEDAMDPSAAARFAAAVASRADGMPVAYLTGETEFWSLCIAVTPDTLVPRPETEILVEQALNRIPRNDACRVLDLGTGCGAIGLAIATERPMCLVVATDLSSGALSVAKENASRLGLANVEFVQGRWTDAVAGRHFDLVVSNPPYVASGDPCLKRLRHEPVLALAAGPDGLDAITDIAAGALTVMDDDGVLLLEHGATQADAVEAVLRNAGWTRLTRHADLAGLPRVAVAMR